MSTHAAPPEPPMPDPVRDLPPDDRFCDLILNGGVASGVVYPWAIVELARHYRFRRIGGNSVGAMAAALAAAAEYGRCWGNPDALEVLRRTPLDLAEEKNGDALMLRLFQPSEGVRRLFDALVTGIRHMNANQPPWVWGLLTVRDVLHEYGLARWWLAGALVLLLPALALVDQPLPWGLAGITVFGALVIAERKVGRDKRPVRAGILIALLLAMLAAHWMGWLVAGVLPGLAALGWVLVVALLGLVRLWPDLQALKENGYGLCTGKAQSRVAGQDPPEAALVDWLHEGIQRSAGRERHDPPLTFRELWNAPRAGGAPGAHEESISLEMFSTNVTLGRPVTWPLRDRNTRLFFRPEEWACFFSPTLLNAVLDATIEYAPANDSDPPVSADTKGYYEVPGAGMPIAIAARLSLSFPFLFSCIPVHAIDYEGRHGARRLRKCQLTDGGLCTNFPVHLFDAAHPRWPTFGLMLSRRISTRRDESNWLPEYHVDGRADNWLRIVPGATQREPGPVAGLIGLLAGMVGTPLEWNDNLTTRLPHVRNRVLRMALRPGEGQLNIAMPRGTILRMAHEYGTQSGRKLVEQFKSDTGVPTKAWQEHLYVRAVNQLRVLTQHLRGYAAAASAGGFTAPLPGVLSAAVSARPLRQKKDEAEDRAIERSKAGIEDRTKYHMKVRAPDLLGEPLTATQQAALLEAVNAVADLSQLLERLEPHFGPYQPMPPTRLQLRSRI